jgi:hypothetical protein
LKFKRILIIRQIIAINTHLIKITCHPIVKTLSCRDVGYSCDFILEGKAEDDTFITNGLERALKERGLKPENITPELKEKLKGLIHNS